MLSSTNLLTFYVNDLLDFAQINSGNFRQDCRIVNIKETIEEVMLVQKIKAEMSGIQLTAKFVNFPLKKDAQIAGNDKIEEEMDYIVCTDMRRIQQVLLNF